MENVLVSIVVPVYNVEKYLEECINSILLQTYNNIEILMINDGSTDNSGYICDLYKKKDKRINVFHKKNEGLGLTRNYGLSKAKGKYVMFVDSDDYILKNAVELLINNLQKNDTVIAGYTKVSDNGKILYEEKYKKEKFINKSVKNKLLPRFVGSLPSVKDSIFTTVCAKLYSMDLIKKYNIKFKSEREFQSEDLGFQFEYFRYSKSVCVIERSVYYYRFNPNSLTTKYKKNRFSETLKVYNYINDSILFLELPQSTFLRNKKMLFVQIRACLSQESKRISKKSRRERIKSVKQIVDNKIVVEAVNNYPINLLNFKQKIFLKLLKNKNYNILLFLIEFGLC